MKLIIHDVGNFNLKSNQIKFYFNLSFGFCIKLLLRTNHNRISFCYIWFDSFVQEFVAAPLDGVSLLLEVLRSIQLSQQNNIGQTNTTGKMNAHTYQRRALLDELACLCVINYILFIQFFCIEIEPANRFGFKYYPFHCCCYFVSYFY